MKYMLTVVLALMSLSVAGCSEDEDVDEGVTQCGPAICSATQYCCDAACGLCIEQLVACTETCD